MMPLVIKLCGAHRLNQDITHHVKKVLPVYASIESCQQQVSQHVVAAIQSILIAENIDECVTNCCSDKLRQSLQPDVI